MERPSTGAFIATALLCLVAGVFAGYVIGEKHAVAAQQKSVVANAPSAEPKKSDTFDHNNRKSVHSTITPQNPNTAGGTFNPMQAGGAAGVTQPGAGGDLSDTPSESAAQGAGQK